MSGACVEATNNTTPQCADPGPCGNCDPLCQSEGEGTGGETPFDLEAETNEAQGVVLSPQGSITLEVQDLLGVFARGRIDQALLLFRSEIEPRVDSVETITRVYPGQRIELTGDGFLRASEGSTWAVVTQGEVREEEGVTRDVTGARARVLWGGERTTAYLPAVP